LKVRYLGIAQRAKAHCVFLVLEVSFKALSNHSPGADHYPRNAESGDRPYQLCASSFSVSGNTEVEAFGPNPLNLNILTPEALVDGTTSARAITKMVMSRTLVFMADLLIAPDHDRPILYGI
jgi:hypothetical protein